MTDLARAKPPRLEFSLLLDFEWQSRTSVRTSGLHRVLEDPSTRVLCCGWQVVRTESATPRWEVTGEELWCLGSAAPEFAQWAAREDVLVVAHNAEVEQLVLWSRFGVAVPRWRLSDTAARAARLGLPRSLEGSAEALGLEERKDGEGHRVMLKLSRARRPSREDRSEFWTPESKPVDFQKLYEYCLQDLRVLRELHRCLPELEPQEWAVWQETLRANGEGMPVDLPAAQRLLALAEAEQERLATEFKKVTGVSPAAKNAAALLGMESLDKEHVRDEIERLRGENLSDMAPWGVARKRLAALELRQQWARSSTKKLVAVLNRTNLDGRLRGQLVYGGAERTLRWAGSGVQLHNLPKGNVADMDAAYREVEALPPGPEGAAAFGLLRDDPLGRISGMLRGLFLGPCLVGDEAQVEARTLAWLAGEEVLLRAFEAGADPYCEMASDIYGRQVTKADKHERFVGKEAVLGAGFQLGPKKFRDALKAKANVEVTEEFAAHVIYTFRRRFPRIAALWRVFGDGLEHAVRHQSRCIQVGPVTMGTGQFAGGVPYAWVNLPSGRRLYYARPEIGPEGVEYLGRDQYRGGKWGRVKTYGGKITENVVQALARDILASAVLRLADRGCGISLTVHDEVVVPVERGGTAPISASELRAVLEEHPSWAPGLPLKAEVFYFERYRK